MEEEAPLAPASQRRYLSRVRGFLARLGSNVVYGDPLIEASVRHRAVRGLS